MDPAGTGVLSRNSAFQTRERGADVEGKAEVVLARRLPHRRDRGHQVGIDRIDVGILDLGELVVGERGIEMMALAVDPVLHGAAERLLGPRADAGLGIRRDVGGVDGSERRLERKIAGERRPVRAGMAGGAVAIVGQDPAALDQSLVEGTGVRPRDRGHFGLVREDRKSGGQPRPPGPAPPTRQFG